MATVSVTNIEKEAGESALTNLVSASTAPDRPSTSVVAVSMAGVIVAAVVMWLLYRYVFKPTTIHFMTGYVPYAGIVFMTAALERFLEPLSHVLLSNDQVKQTAAKSKSAAHAAAADPGTNTAEVQKTVNTAADAQAKVDSTRTQRALIFWGIATICGLIISGGFGFFLLQSVASPHTQVNTFLDLVVTGLTIGAGTKPLHDLITSVQTKAASSA